MGRKSRSKKPQSRYSRLKEGDPVSMKHLTSLSKGNSIYNSKTDYTMNSISDYLLWMRNHYIDELPGIQPLLLSSMTLLTYTQWQGKYKTFYVTSPEIVDFIDHQSVTIEHSIVANDLMREEIPIVEISEFKGTYRAAVVHFIDQTYSVLLVHKEQNEDLSDDSDGIMYVKGNSTDRDVGSIAIGDGLDPDLVNHTKIGSEVNVPKTMINLFLYMNTFPEAVLDGPPPIRLLESERKQRSISIGASETIKRMYVNGITPHMRRGHYRILKSEVFTKKRYQTIYISPTMVKGTASHVVKGNSNIST